VLKGSAKSIITVMKSTLLNFRGKIAIVTGGSGGLGERYAIDLAKRGASVIVNDVSSSADKLRAVVKRIIDDGGIAKENFNSVLDGKQIVDDAINHFGSCDILINNAGILRDKSFHKMSKEEWKDVLDVHLQGTFEICHAGSILC
jgi:NAD(P)-dependent dehydrogenase (short-subunit alcohol dehydrogenase family)